MTPPANDSGFADDPFRSTEFTPAEMDEFFEVLADATRRCALRTLRDAGGVVSFDELVGDVARQTATEPPGREYRREIATSLYHVHLPKLESVDLVSDFDPDGEVLLADDAGDGARPLFD